MLIKAKALNGYKLGSLDGEIGKVKEFYFDDTHWTIRYLVADTGSWLTDRKVLLSPYALVAVVKDEQVITVNLNKKQIEKSPSLNSENHISRQFEESYYGYYGWPAYWGGPHMWGFDPFLVREPYKWKWDKPSQGAKEKDPHLRSTREVSGYHIQATDGEIGHLDDFIIDDESWAIRYLVVATRNWWPGKRVLVSPKWIGAVSWSDSKVLVNLSRAAIERSPEYTEESLLTRDYETGLHQHYKRQGYWVEEQAAKEHARGPGNLP